MKPSGNTPLAQHVLQMMTNTASFHRQNYSNWHQQQTEEKKNETFNCSCFFLLLCFSMSLFDLICFFGLVMAKQLIQQTCLMRCEACTQLQLYYPLPTSLLGSGAHRQSLRVTWKRPDWNLKPVRQTRDQSYTSNTTHSTLYVLPQSHR